MGFGTSDGRNAGRLWVRQWVPGTGIHRRESSRRYGGSPGRRRFCIRGDLYPGSDLPAVRFFCGIRTDP